MVPDSRQPAPEPLAAFDFDGTLLQGDTLQILHRLLQGWPATAAFKERYLGTILGTTPLERQVLVHSLGRLLGWLPALYGVLALANAGRYLLWRLLLGAVGVGGWKISSRCGNLAARLALTATPGKLGELSRAHQLHKVLGYRRSSLLHPFGAERLCDLAAVLAWLTLLVPGQLLRNTAPSAAFLPAPHRSAWFSRWC